MNLYIINTNLQKDKRYEKEMVEKQKCAAYRDTKHEIEWIKKGDKVLLYTNKKGIIARGVATGVVHKKSDNEEPNAEYYMPLEEFTELIAPISSTRIRKILKIADQNEARPFNRTTLKFNENVSKIIWDEICKFV